MSLKEEFSWLKDREELERFLLMLFCCDISNEEGLFREAGFRSLVRDSGKVRQKLISNQLFFSPFSSYVCNRDETIG